jgi:hypothetical protein
VLSNLYLHFTLDLWFAKKFKSLCRGEAYLVRFADDFVGCFQFQDDAQNFQRQLRERFARFNLELAEDKTRMLLFGRFAAAMCGKHGQRPETFEFLGFKHVHLVGTFADTGVPQGNLANDEPARGKWRRLGPTSALTSDTRGRSRMP